MWLQNALELLLAILLLLNWLACTNMIQNGSSPLPPICSVLTFWYTDSTMSKGLELQKAVCFMTGLLSALTMLRCGHCTQGTHTLMWVLKHQKQEDRCMWKHLVQALSTGDQFQSFGILWAGREGFRWLTMPKSHVNPDSWVRCIQRRLVGEIQELNVEEAYIQRQADVKVTSCCILAVEATLTINGTALESLWTTKMPIVSSWRILDSYLTLNPRFPDYML